MSEHDGGLSAGHSASLASDRGAPSLARAAVSGWLDGHTTSGVRDDACLLVSELVTNSVRHGGQPAGAQVEVRAMSAAGMVRVEVEDAGRSGPVRRRRADGPDGGFGLGLVEHLAARWGVVHDPGTVVWFELAMAPL